MGREEGGGGGGGGKVGTIVLSKLNNWSIIPIASPFSFFSSVVAEVSDMFSFNLRCDENGVLFFVLKVKIRRLFLKKIDSSVIFSGAKK